MSYKNNLIWIDLEMTGLNPDKDRILEIATIITNSNLKVLEEGPVLSIHQSEVNLSIMNKWNNNIHTNSGLINRVRISNLKENQVEKKILLFLKKWVPYGKSPICGNSISQDRRFLFRYMPKLESYFHYRCLDVSTLKELALRWKPEIFLNFQKKNSHTALEDLYESIEELSYYKKYLFKL